MLIITYATNFLGMILLPILLGFYLARRFNLSWKLFWFGALAFIGAQIVHIPVLYGLTALFQTGVLPAPPPAWTTAFNALVLGLLAGLCETTARWVLYKFILKKARTWPEGLMVGAGHGGIEAIILGVLAGISFFAMFALRSSDPSVLGVPAEQIGLARMQVSAYWSAPVYLSLLGFVERIFAVCLHLSLSVMVLRSVTHRQPLWFWLAVLWHALVDGVAVYLLPVLEPLALEGVIGIFAVLSLGILFAMRPPLTPARNDLPAA
jgi:uncharacterized membrane protein YhfC